MKKVLFIAIVLLLVASFGISAFMVGNYLIEGKRQEDRYEELSQIAANAQSTTEAAATTEATVPQETAEETTVPAETTEPTEPTEPGILPGYKEIYEMNNDVVGWIDGRHKNGLPRYADSFQPQLLSEPGL